MLRKYSLLFPLALLESVFSSPVNFPDITVLNPANTIKRSVPVVSVLPLTGGPDDPENQVTGLGEPISINEYFSIDANCYTDIRNIEHTGFKNRGRFYEQAVKDAMEIADKAQKWPEYGLDASDMYFGQDAKTDAYSPDIIANIKRAAEWDKGRWGFDNYIILTCDDPYKACHGSVDGDPRPVGCYVNNTSSWFWNKSRISCCGPFFSSQTIDQAFDRNKFVKDGEHDLRYLQTSGGYLFHEMMHTKEVTQDRPHIIDEYFTGGSRRIYGPVDVWRAARAGREGPAVTTHNADSYAQFASALYFKDLFQGDLPYPQIPRPSTERESTPPSELILDNDTNYISLVRPPPSTSCAGTPTTLPPVSRAFADSKIQEFCSFLVSHNVVVDSDKYKYNPVGYVYRDETDGENELWLSVSKDAACRRNTGYEVVESECKHYLGMALDGCNTDSVEKKWGGEVRGHCSAWNVTTLPGREGRPPNGFVR